MLTATTPLSHVNKTKSAETEFVIKLVCGLNKMIE